MQNLRVEFYGGPLDGEVMYKAQSTIPSHVYHTLTTLEEIVDRREDIPLHAYTLKGTPPLLTYAYQGIVNKG